MEIKKVILISSVMSLFTPIVAPATTAVASQIEYKDSVQETQGYRLDENNVQFMTIVKGLKDSGHVVLAEDLFSFFDGKVITAKNKDQLVLEFEQYFGRRPQTQAALSSVLATIAAAMAVTKGMYEAGHYAARQLHTRGILTRSQYIPNGGWWMAGIAVAFGIPASLGFDDYMHNR